LTGDIIMGGNAIKESKRVTTDELNHLIPEVIGIIRSVSNPGCKVTPIPSYSKKADHGDLDILVSRDATWFNWHDAIKDALGSAHMVRNGPVTSYLFKDTLQVDVIVAPEDEFDFSLNYFSYNDLGNLIGRVAHRHGLKFGHNGLFYVLRDDTKLLGEILISRDFFRVIHLLGFAPHTFKDMFSTLEDIFEYVASSLYFEKEMYPLEHRSHTARTRDAKRATYQKFLKWIDETRPPDGPLAGRGEMIHDFIEEYCPHVKMCINGLLHANERSKEAKLKLNGELVSQWTGYTGKPLGELMCAIRDRLGNTKRQIDEKILSMKAYEITDLVFEEVEKFETKD
jgi:hypothetical protein